MFQIESLQEPPHLRSDSHESRKPTATSSENITELLVAWSDGDPEALEGLTPLVYQELHRLARSYMGRERPGHLLQTTALIHEAFLRLVEWKSVRWKNRAHFFGLAAQIMRHILVDYARSQKYAKRGGGMRCVTLDEAMPHCDERSRDVVAVDEALRALEKVDAFKSRLVELRFFGGLTVEEAATVLEVSPRTAAREWSLARAWLFREIQGAE